MRGCCAQRQLGIDLPTCSECRSQREQVIALHTSVAVPAVLPGAGGVPPKEGYSSRGCLGSAGLAGVQPASVQMQRVYSHQIV